MGGIDHCITFFCTHQAKRRVELPHSGHYTPQAAALCILAMLLNQMLNLLHDLLAGQRLMHSTHEINEHVLRGRNGAQKTLSARVLGDCQYNTAKQQRCTAAAHVFLRIWTMTSNDAAV